MKNKILSSLLVACLLSLTSCAGLISGKTQNVFLRATDGSEDVDVEVSSAHGIQKATLPTSIVVPRAKAPLTITVNESKCYKKSTTHVPSKYNVMLAADLLGGLFGLTGTSIDVSSGAAWAYDDTVFVNVREKSHCK